MTETLTESFCERCGTRYTFESDRPKRRLKSVKVLSRGLKNFVLSDDTSINEAMAAARSETDREATSHQLDAFHKTFNFCMSCRQYTCPNCWNEAEVRCLSCAPLTIAELPLTIAEVPATFEELVPLLPVAPGGEPTAGNGRIDHEHEHDDLPAAVTAEAEKAPDSTPEAMVEPEPAMLAEAASAVEPIAAAGTQDVDPAYKAVHQTASLLRRFRPGQNLDAELDAYERGLTETEPLAITANEPPSAAADEPPSAEVVPPEPAIAAMAEHSSAADVVAQPTWQITAPDTGEPPVGRPTVGNGVQPLQAKGTRSPAAGPEWPSQPQWRSSTPAAGLPFLGRPAEGQGGIEALWAASNQELVAAPPSAGRPASNGIQPCVSCGLSLSANARFCRRCGTLQGR